MAFEEDKVKRERKNVVVGIGFDGHARELLDWAVVKVAQSGDSVVALHVCRNSDSTTKAQSLLNDYLHDYQGLCQQKKVGLAAEVVKGSSIRKLLVKEAKNRGAYAVIVGLNKNSSLGYRGRVSIAKYCTKRLPLTTQVMAIHNGKIVYQSCSNSQQLGSRGEPSPSVSVSEVSSNFKDYRSEYGDSEVSEWGRASHELCHSFANGYSPKDEVFLACPFQRRNRSSLSSISLPVDEKPGWPLLQTSSEITQMSKEARKMSVVQWVMSLPDRSMLHTPRCKSNVISPETSDDLERILKSKSTNCKLFSYPVLKASTYKFSPENLIGRGGCNSVYKGVLPGGKRVAVKILKSSKGAWKEFIQEVDIMTTVKHKSIIPLLGVCIADDNLISVYNFLSKGNLEENLQGNEKGNCVSVLPWEVRFKIAIGVAETLNYLHNECPRPVIHRDVKSSNILLSDEFEPQLSDFGLSIWGPTTKASYITDSDVVGTFGYLAPEYFMYGNVSDKVDVYSFGVVLLELLSGRKAIGFQTSKGQESLVIWAKPKLDNGDVNAILDQNLDKQVDVPQMQRMACAAKLCLTQSARLRPNISQILNILTGEEVLLGELLSTEVGMNPENQGDNDDEVYPDSSAESHMSIALRDVCDKFASFSSQDQSSPISVEEYLRRRWSRSSSLD